MKKRLVALLVMLMACAVLSGCGNSNKKVLRVYNAGEYIDKELNAKFEKQYNCKVVYETFDSNEALYTKVMSGSKYDVLIPSDYMIERLVKEDFLQPVNWDLITNKGALIDSVMGLDYDPANTYSVPYFWGTVGIVYDTTVVSEEDAAEGWDLLLNTKYKGQLYMYDSERDSFMIALKALGYSMNTADKAEVEEAYQWLITQRDTMDPVYITDDVMDNMISGNKAIAVVYSGDATYVMSENEKLAFVEPKQGTNVWCDAMVIMKDAEEVELAHQYMNFMLEHENALANTVEVGYTSPVKAAYDEMVAGDYAEINAYIPRVGFDKDEVFRYQTTEFKSYCADLWTKVKAK